MTAIKHKQQKNNSMYNSFDNLDATKDVKNCKMYYFLKLYEEKSSNKL